MLDFTQKLHKELINKLEERDKNYDPKTLEDPRLDLVTTTIEKIMEKLKSYSFDSEKEEIFYFKCILPETLALHVYYVHIMEWDRMARNGSEKDRYDFYNSVFTKAENFRNEEREFYEYSRDMKSSRDRLYYLRTSPLNKDRMYQPGIITDPSSPTIHCCIRAKLIAYSLLEHKLHQSITISNSNQAPSTDTDSVLTWTLSKISLSELIYAFKESKAFNHGKADVKTITEYLEKVFHIRIDNISRSFQEIMSRKMGYTVFLDLMKDQLLKRIDTIESRNMN